MDTERRIGRRPEREKLTSAIYLILIKDEKILLLRRANTGYEDGNYSLPAGHKDKGEFPKAAMARETEEEIGIIIGPEDLKCVHTMMRINAADAERMDQFFIAKEYQGEPYNKEPHKCSDLKWFPLDELPENIIPYVKAAIAYSLSGITYSEWPDPS